MTFTFIFTANYIATNNFNWHTINSTYPTVTVTPIVTTTGTIVTNSTTNSTIVETHESKLIFVTNGNSNLREV